MNNFVNKTAKTKKTSPDNVIKIIAICEKYGVEITGNVFSRTPEDVEKIILLCKEHKLNVDNMKTCFRKTAKEFEEIIEICEKHHIFIEPIIFYSKPKDLEKTIEYVSNFSTLYLKPTLLVKDLEKLQRSMPYMKKLGLLKYAVKDPGVLELSVEEIRERTAALLCAEYPIHQFKRYSQEDRLSSVYTLSKKSFEKFLIDNSISAFSMQLKKDWILEKERQIEEQIKIKQQEKNKREQEVEKE